MPNDSHDGALRRAWNAWNRFWFKPADPTPLCLMRICAGILTLYVHLAYTFDLVAFFGPDGWYGQKEANQTRQGYPHRAPPLNDWAGLPGSFTFPRDPADRRLLRKFLDRAFELSDPAELAEFVRVVEIVRVDNTDIPARRDEVLRYLTTLSGDPNQDRAALQSYVDDKMSKEAQDKLPDVALLDPRPEARKAFAERLVAFRQLLGTDRFDTVRLIELFTGRTAEDWASLKELLVDLKALPPEQRQAELDYQELWGVPTKLTYSRGMPVFSPWFHVTDLRVMYTIHALCLFVMLLFTLGLYTRVTSVLTWLAALFYINRAQVYLFGQDTMMNLCLCYLMFSPCGARWSLDRWMARKQADAEGKSAPPVKPSISAGFVLRVFQVQFCLMYFSAGLSKLKGSAWQSGTALYYCLANAEFSPMHVEFYRNFLSWLCKNRAIWELFMAGSALFTLLTEITFPYLVWTKMRPVMVAAAIVLHTGIAILMGLTVFQLFMFTLLLCFVPADAIEWLFEPNEKGK
ncbi:MAG: HTTM domain-containing protein [Gemmataceae bacterium]|nr:HTTM domain-containing protein [Gemmataceae bacterium]